MKVVLFVCMLTVVTAGEADREVNNINSVIEHLKAIRSDLVGMDHQTNKKFPDDVTDLSKMNSDDEDKYVVCTLADAAETSQISLDDISTSKYQDKHTIRRRSIDCKQDARYRTMDGSCNNARWPTWGSTNQPFKRFIDPAYDDGKFVPRMRGVDGYPLPSPRAISVAVHPGVDSPSNDHTVMVMQWGQFVDHDLTGTPLHADTREQLNLLTSFVDASNVYGLSQDQINHLRNGRDDRVNVFPGLAVLHTVFVREHNRLVKELADVMPSTTPDDVLFEEARKIVSAIIQQVTYREWLPIIVGPLAMRKYRLTPGFSFRYNITQNPTIYNVFATAAFRYGHSTIPRFLTLGDRHVPIEQLFNRPSEVIKDLDTVLKAILKDRHQEVNRFINSGMTEHLFETSGNNGFDIVSLNIQRGRDHGLPSYNSFRKACQLSEVTSFDDSVFGKAGPALKSVYSSPDDIDIFTGAVAEQHLHGGAVGPLLACLIGQQFHDLKYGDSFWFETSHPRKGFTSGQLPEIRRMRFAKILCRNSGVKSIQRDPFTVYSKESNPMIPCNDLPTIDLTKWRR
ncbi:peroxidase-like protein 3 [Haliotis rufescens]|uniref:peroxidase-like protein 3 n=1 Tax=Haliotis rufescens TaxID=6454 RepID=UPI00201EEB87|nr:peroxidase-like protein 3 [Haliotis rufescens]